MKMTLDEFLSSPLLDVGTLKRIIEHYPDDAQILIMTPNKETNIPAECVSASIDECDVEVTLMFDFPDVDLSEVETWFDKPTND